MTLKRYDLERWQECIETPDGEWSKAADVAPLLALAEQMATALRGALEACPRNCFVPDCKDHDCLAPSKYVPPWPTTKHRKERHERPRGRAA